MAGEACAETDMDKFAVKVAEEFEPHVVLPAVDNEAQNELGKNIDSYPGLILRPGTHRFYPYHEVAAHLLGHLGRVDRRDLEEDDKADKDLLREYLPNDLTGKGGIEAPASDAARLAGEDRKGGRRRANPLDAVAGAGSGRSAVDRYRAAEDDPERIRTRPDSRW